MKDKKLRELLNEEGFIYSCPHHGIITPKTIGLKGRIRYLEKVVNDQQEQIKFILNHLNLDIEKFKGYVEKKLDR